MFKIKLKIDDIKNVERMRSCKKRLLNKRIKYTKKKGLQETIIKFIKRNH